MLGIRYPQAQVSFLQECINKHKANDWKWLFIDWNKMWTGSECLLISEDHRELHPDPAETHGNLFRTRPERHIMPFWDPNSIEVYPGTRWEPVPIAMPYRNTQRTADFHHASGSEPVLNLFLVVYVSCWLEILPGNAAFAVIPRATTAFFQSVTCPEQVEMVFIPVQLLSTQALQGQAPPTSFRILDSIAR